MEPQIEMEWSICVKFRGRILLSDVITILIALSHVAETVKHLVQT